MLPGGSGEARGWLCIRLGDSQNGPNGRRGGCHGWGVGAGWGEGVSGFGGVAGGDAAAGLLGCWAGGAVGGLVAGAFFFRSAAIRSISCSTASGFFCRSSRALGGGCDFFFSQPVSETVAAVRASSVSRPR